MIRQSVIRGIRPFSSSVRALAEGDVAKGGAQGDAFSKREKANEDKYVKDQELAKLKALRVKLEGQKNNIDELVKNIDEMQKKHGGSEK